MSSLRKGTVRLHCVGCIALALAASAVPLEPLPTDAAEVTAESARPARPRVFTRVFALCVGIDRYENVAGIQSLQFAESDARSMDRVLREVYGYESRLLCAGDATRSGILAAIDVIGSAIDAGVGNVDASRAKEVELSGEAIPTYAIVLYFAGHGATVSEPPAPGQIARRWGFFLPYDTTAALEGSPLAAYQDTAIDFGKLSRKLLDKFSDEERVLHIVMIVDACFSGFAGCPTARGTNVRVYESLCLYPTRQVLTAGTDLQLSFEQPEREHGYFTGAILDLLGQGRDGNILTVGELFQSARMRVLEELSREGLLGRQEPQLRALKISDGDFAFIPLSAEDDQLALVLDPDQPATSRGREEPVSEERLRELRRKADQRKPSDPPDLSEEAQATFDDLYAAAAQGDPRAIEALYHCYASGIGTPRDDERARSWGQETCEVGDQETAVRVMGEMLAHPRISRLLESKAGEKSLLGKSAKVLGDPENRELAVHAFEALGKVFGNAEDPLSAIVATQERIAGLLGKNDWDAARKEALRWKSALKKLPSAGQPQEVVQLVEAIRSAIDRLLAEGIARTEKKRALTALGEIENSMRELQALLRIR